MFEIFAEKNILPEIFSFSTKILGSKSKKIRTFSKSEKIFPTSDFFLKIEKFSTFFDTFFLKVLLNQKLTK